MLISIATILIIIWFVFLCCGFVFHGLIHVILAAAVIMLLLNMVKGKGDSGDGV